MSELPADPIRRGPVAPWMGPAGHAVTPFPPSTWAAPLPARAIGPCPRWAATIAVAAVIAAVVLGGLVTDSAIAAPSAGTVTVSGPVTITAASGWTVSDSAGAITGGVALQKSNAILVVQVVATDYTGTDRQLLSDAEETFRSEMGQVSFGESKVLSLGGREASEVTFSALVSSTGSSGVIDGELVCLVAGSGGSSYAVLVQVGVPQGYLDTISTDVETMAASVTVAP